jgi:hypothetical protein
MKLAINVVFHLAGYSDDKSRIGHSLTALWLAAGKARAYRGRG